MVVSISNARNSSCSLTVRLWTDCLANRLFVTTNKVILSVKQRKFFCLSVFELLGSLHEYPHYIFKRICNKAIKELPIKRIVLITTIFNAILRLEYYPKSWKISLITLIPKPGKPIHETSY